MEGLPNQTPAATANFTARKPCWIEEVILSVSIPSLILGIVFIVDGGYMVNSDSKEQKGRRRLGDLLLFLMLHQKSTCNSSDGSPLGAVGCVLGEGREGWISREEPR